MERIGKRFWGLLLMLAMLLTALPLNIAAADSVAMPTADVTPGLYRETKTVTLSTATPGATIYYSTDNMMPELTEEFQYTGAITVDKTTNICAVAELDGVTSDPVTFSYIIKGEEQPVTSFIAMSDIHITSEEADGPRVEKMFDVIQSICPEGPAAIISAGDQISDNHVAHPEQPDRQNDHEIVETLFEKELTDHGMDETDIYMAVGNHDANFAGMDGKYPQEWFPTDTGWYRTQIDGYEVLVLYTETNATEQQNWLKAQLEDITKNGTEMDKPIFVVGHRPFPNTVMDGQYAFWSDSYNKIMADYPQIITFTGHTHLNTNNEKSIYQKDFTSLNTGSMSYIETEHGLMHRTDGTVEGWETPVTQLYLVEVFNDRVEFDRVAVNADWGDVKKSAYIPAEPFHNTGVSVGERWTVTTGANMKENYQYTADKRKGSAPEFPEDAQVSVSQDNNGTAQITFSQVKDVQKVVYYEVSLLNSEGGEVDKIKVLPDNWYSPVPRSLTYPMEDIPQFGETYRFSVVGVDSFGNRSEALVSEEFQTEKLPGILPTYLVNETFAEEPVDGSTHAIPYANTYKEGSAKMQYQNGVASLVNTGTNGNIELQMPLMTGNIKASGKEPVSVNTPSGPLMVEFEWQDATSDGNEIQAYFRNAAGENVFVVRAYAGNYNFRFINSSNGSGSNFGSTSAAGSNAMTKVRVLFNLNGRNSTVDGVWLNDTLVDDSTGTFLRDVGEGLSQICFSHKTGGDQNEACFNIDNVRVWVPAAEQAAQLAAADEAKITFDDVKGENESADNVTKDLALSAKTETENGLIVTGWKSSNENVVTTDGKVNRPGVGEADAEVTLTPVLGVLDFADEVDGDYATADGQPITITVPTTDTGGGVAPDEVNNITYYVNETYDEMPTDGTTHSIPMIGTWGNGAADWTVENGKLALVKTTQDASFNLQIPFMPGEMKENAVPAGKVYIDFTWQHGANEGQTDLYVQAKSGKNLLKLIAKDNKALELDYYDTNQALKSYATTADTYDYKNPIKIKLLMDVKEDGSATLEGFWVNDTLVKNTSQQVYEAGEGLAGLVSSRWGTGGANGYHILEVDELKVYQPVTDQVNAKAASAVEAADILGSNADKENITGDLTLKIGETTDNGLTILGWESSDSAVIGTDGKVTRPAKGSGDKTVTLTPILGLRNTENETDVAEIVKANGTPITVTVKEQTEETPAGFQVVYLVNEDFDTLPTEDDAATRPVPSISAWSGAAASSVINDGAVELKLDAGSAQSTQLNIPLMPGTADGAMPRGENMVEFRWKHHADANQISVYVQGSKEIDDKGTHGHVMKFEKYGSNTTIYKSNNGTSSASGFTSIMKLEGQTFSDYTTIRLKINTAESGKTYLEQLWIDGAAKLDSRVELFDAGDGLCQVMFAPGNTTVPVGDASCSVDYIKTWQSAPSQLAEYAKASPVNFSDIQGNNTSANQVTDNLTLSAITELANGLKVVGWKSSNESVVQADGTVIRPEDWQGDAKVTLTPIVSAADTTNEGTDGVITAEGAPIEVTVKAQQGTGPAVITTEYYINEPFDAQPTDDTTQPLPRLVKKDGSDASIVYENGYLDYRYVSGDKDGCQLEIPLMPGSLDGESGAAAPIVPRGEVYVEVNYKMGQTPWQVFMAVCGKEAVDGEYRLFRLNVMDDTVNVDKYEGSSSSTISSFEVGANEFRNTTQKLRMLFDTSDGKTVLKKAWLGDTEIASNQTLNENGGLYNLRIAAGSNCPDLAEGDTIALIDSVKVWKPLANTLAEKAAEPGAVVTFDDIKGANTDANEVTADLDFATKKVTENGLTITGWKSSNTKVVGTDGTVSRQKEDAPVELTPILGVKDLEQETGQEYTTVDGTPISIVVKGDPNSEESLTDLQYFINENFDNMPTEAEGDTRPIPETSFWGSSTASPVVNDGAVEMVLDSGKANETQLNIPLMPGKTKENSMPRGENVIEFEWKRNSKSDQTPVYIRGGAGHVLKLNITGNSIDIQTSQDGTASASKFNTIATVKDATLTEWTKVKLLFDTTGETTYIEQVWINGTPRLSTRASTFDAAEGLQEIQIAPGNGSISVGEVVCSVNYIKTRLSTEDQIANLSKEIVTFDKIKGTNTAADNVTANLDFSAQEISGFKVQEWKSSNEDVIAPDGTVTRPPYTQSDIQVTLTPVLGIQDIEGEGDGEYVYGDGAPIVVTVKKMGAAEAVAQVKTNLDFSDIQGVNTAAENVIDNLNLITEMDGVTITWTVQSMTPSGTTAVVDPATGMVVRPQMDESDVTAVLRAQLSCEGETDTKDITITIKKLDVTTQEYLQQLKNALTFAEIAGGNASEREVTQNLNLMSGFKGAQVTWTSSQPAVVYTDGTVVQPDYPNPQVEVDLTATLSMEGADPVSKTFHITVIPSDAENLAAGKTVKASVTADGGTSAANLTDGSMDTTFRTKSGAKQYTVTIDFGEETPFNTMTVHEVANEDGAYAIEAYTVDISTDGTNWTTVHTGTTVGTESKISFDPVLARYIRLNVTQKKSGMASELAELEVRLQPTDEQRAKADIAYLDVEIPDTISANSIVLPVKGIFGSELTWTATPAGILSGGVPSGDEATFTITHPVSGQRITLIATATSGSAQATKNFNPYVSGTQTGGSGGSGGGGGGTGSSSGGNRTPNISAGDLSGVTNPNTNINQTPQEGFRDMEQTQWAIPYVMKLYTHGVVQGDENGNFQPERSVSREEFVKMLVLSLDIPESETAVPFTDMQQGGWYVSYIQAAVAAGIVNGLSETQFGVGETINREDMATMIYRAMNYLEIALEQTGEAAVITDAQNISGYAQEAVSALVRSGVISGNENGQFLPQNQATRAEAAKMLAMLMEE